MAVNRIAPPPVVAPISPPGFGSGTTSSSAPPSLGWDSWNPSGAVPPPVVNPVPPPVISSVPPPVIGPVPSPVIEPVDPVPPPPVVDPVPPPVAYNPYMPSWNVTGPEDVVNQYLSSHQQLQMDYDDSPMSYDQYQAYDQQLTNSAASELVSMTQYPVSDRQTALSELYNDSPMTYDQYNAYSQELTQQAFGSGW